MNKNLTYLQNLHCSEFVNLHLQTIKLCNSDVMTCAVFEFDWMELIRSKHIEWFREIGLENTKTWLKINHPELLCYGQGNFILCEDLYDDDDEPYTSTMDFVEREINTSSDDENDFYFCNELDLEYELFGETYIDFWNNVYLGDCDITHKVKLTTQETNNNFELYYSTMIQVQREIKLANLLK